MTKAATIDSLRHPFKVIQIKLPLKRGNARRVEIERHDVIHEKVRVTNFERLSIWFKGDNVRFSISLSLFQHSIKLAGELVMILVFIIFFLILRQRCASISTSDSLGIRSDGVVQCVGTTLYGLLVGHLLCHSCCMRRSVGLILDSLQQL